MQSNQQKHQTMSSTEKKTMKKEQKVIELLSTKIYYTSIYIFFILFISRQVQKSKNDENPTSTSEVTYITFLLFYLNCFLSIIHLNLK